MTSRIVGAEIPTSRNRRLPMECLFEVVLHFGHCAVLRDMLIFRYLVPLGSAIFDGAVFSVTIIPPGSSPSRRKRRDVPFPCEIRLRCIFYRLVVDVGFSDY